MKKVKSVLVLTSCLLSICVVVMFSCNKKDTSGTLSPARNIIGTWKSLVPVTVSEVTNMSSCVDLTTTYTYATFQCKFTFEISQYAGDTLLYVHIYGDSTSGKYPVCGVPPPIEDGYPIDFNGRVSSSALTLYDQIFNYNTSHALVSGLFDVGDFSFTTNLLTGKISWITYSQVGGSNIGWKTDQMSLTKQ